MTGQAMLLQELEVWYVLPALRRTLALALLQQGLQQQDIGKLLQVTKSAVSQYIHNDRATAFSFDRNMRQEIRKSALHLKDGSPFVSEIQNLLTKLRESKAICRFHIANEKGIESNCDLCFR